jgi:hypothetical protein
VKTATVQLTERDMQKLRRAVTGSGGLQSLIRRMQQGIRMREGVGWMTISDDDLARIVPYWRKTGGKAGSGGYQARFPIESLGPYLASAAPLFATESPCRSGVSYCYFKREGALGDPAKIKIGRGTEKRAMTGRSTDNPRVLVTLLKVEERPGCDERYFHHRFQRLRVDPKQEWFWAGDDLLSFIHEQLSRQSEPVQDDLLMDKVGT